MLGCSNQYCIQLQMLPCHLEDMALAQAACGEMEMSQMDRSLLLSMTGGIDICLRHRKSKGLHLASKAASPPPVSLPSVREMPEHVPAQPAKAKAISPAADYKALDQQIAMLHRKKREIARRLQELQDKELFLPEDGNPLDVPSLNKPAMNEILRLYGENISLTDRLCGLQSRQLELLKERYRSHLLSEIRVLAQEADFLE